MRVLLLAYYFPPLGGGGVQRPLKFARYLPELGVDVTVVTGPGKTIDRWSPEDTTLLAEAGSADIRRLGEEPASPAWQVRAEKWLGVTSPWSRWLVDSMVKAGGDLDNQIDVIVTSMPPYEMAGAAVKLARALGKPWVADLRDNWAVDELMLYPTVFHRRWEQRRMRSILSTAAAVVTVSPEAAKRVREHVPELRDRPVVSIPNGFDRSDFPGRPTTRREDEFRIVHAGTVYTDLGRRQRWKLRRLLGGSAEGVDIGTHSHVYLLQAIDLLIRRDPSLRSRIKLVHAGVLSEEDKEVMARSPVVRLLGYLPRYEVISLMYSADLLFLPLYGVSEGLRAAMVPGKTYEYLATQRPILAAVPQGDARDILVQSGNAHICAPDDVEAMADAISAELDGSSPLPAGVPDEVLQRFERRSLTSDFAALLSQVHERSVGDT